MNPILEKMNLLQTVSDISEYTNFIVSEVNDHVVRIAVIDGEYHWHEHDTRTMLLPHCALCNHNIPNLLTDLLTKSTNTRNNNHQYKVDI